MSDTPLDKMDALLRKHRGSADGAAESTEPAAIPGALDQPGPPPQAWLPVLTDVIERGTPPAAAAPVAPAPAEPSPGAEPAAAAAPASPSEPLAVNDSLAETLVSELAPRLSEIMEKQVAAELRKNLDQTVSTLLAQLDVNVREIVREAVAEKLRPPRDPSA